MNLILRGLRVIDPLAGLDRPAQDVWLRGGRIAAIDRRIKVDGARVVELGGHGREPILCPGFIDLHAHLREPGDDTVETVQSGAAAAAAGGFTQVVAMANTRPPVDTPARVGHARARAARAAVRVLPAAALTRGMHGRALVDVSGCAAAGAAAFTDDGRNAAPPRLVIEALRAADGAGRPVMIHPEDEAMIAAANPDQPSVVRCPTRPAAAEVSAVEAALRALADAGRGRLHLQHISAAGSIEALRTAKGIGLAVTAEVTPHHLSMWAPLAEEPQPPGLRKVNPPLRSEADRRAMVEALREGLLDAVATDHAPHAQADKAGDYADASPGMVGLETAFAVCATLGGMGDGWLPVLVERLTAGPWRVLGAEGGLHEPRLELGAMATCVLIDPLAEWQVGSRPFRSRSSNTPLHGVRLRGAVLATLSEGRVVHLDPEAPAALREALDA